MTEPNDPIVTPTIDAPSADPSRSAEPGPPAEPGAAAVNGAGAVQSGDQAQGSAIHNGPQAQSGAIVGGEPERGTTAAQLRRFIKSRPYVPLHELRRRFELNGDCDDVVSIETPDGRCFIGLPEREGRFMADLVRQGEVGIELGHDPDVPIVVGVFPMRPVGR